MQDRTPAHERKCKLCDINSIEDEHFFRNEMEGLYKSAAEHCILFTEINKTLIKFKYNKRFIVCCFICHSISQNSFDFLEISLQ